MRHKIKLNTVERILFYFVRIKINKNKSNRNRID